MRSSSNFRLLLGPLALGAALVAAGGAAHAADPPATPPASPAASPTMSAAAFVDTKNFAFKPDEIVVAPGTTVTFKNSDSVAHTVSATDESFDSGDMAPGATWTHVFSKPGTYAYVCTYHRYMQGTVVVK